MKKIFLAILFSTVLFIGLPFYNVKAMPVTYDIPFSAVPDTISMFYDILNGGTINTSGAHNLDELIAKYQQDQVDAKRFLQPFLNQIWNKMARMALNGEQSLTESSDFVIPVSIADMAYAMGYNIKWWEKYQNTNSIPSISLPSDVEYFSDVNSLIIPGFSTELFSTTWFISGVAGLQSPQLQYSYIGDFKSTSPHTANSGSTYINPVYPVLDINLYSNANGYSVVYPSFTTGTGIFTSKRYILKTGTGSGEVHPNFSSPSNNDSNYFSNSFPNLTSAISYLYQHYLNVNVYVDGVPFAYANGVVVPDLVTNPDVIQVGDTDSLTYDVFFPKIEGLEGLSISEFLKWLEGQLNDGIDSVSLQDLIDDSVPVVVIDDDADANTTPTVAPIVTTVPVEEIIDSDIDTDYPIDTRPTPTSTTYPLPPIPKIVWPSGIPNQVDHTVLAEIIDSTQKVVPDDLMTLIWSTFGLLIVGGLIYILHK